MPSVSTLVVRQIKAVTLVLVEVGLVSDQKLPITRTHGRSSAVTIPAEVPFSDLRGEMAYRDAYGLVEQFRVYNMKFRDGGILQLHYEFQRDNLVSHRLAFLPSPDLESIQADPELYLDDAQELFADCLDSRTVSVPLRFDHDRGAASGIKHPASHLTLGQFMNCRIPVTAPLYPLQFVVFVLQHFYNSALRTFTDKLPSDSAYFQGCASRGEYSVVHIGVPGSSRYPERPVA